MDESGTPGAAVDGNRRGKRQKRPIWQATPDGRLFANRRSGPATRMLIESPMLLQSHGDALPAHGDCRTPVENFYIVGASSALQLGTPDNLDVAPTGLMTMPTDV